MATVFSSVADNALAQLATVSLNNTTTPISIPVVTGQGTRFGTINATGMYVTIWDKTTYPDPLSDPNSEKATITAISTDTITLSRAAAVAHTAQVWVGDLWRTAHRAELATAVNTLENVPAGNPRIYDAVVAGSGGDYTTLGAAIVAGKRSILIRRGTFTEIDASLNTYTIGTNDLYIHGEDRDNTILNLWSNVAGAFQLKGTGPILENLTINVGTAAVTGTNGSNNWVCAYGTSQAVVREVTVVGQGAAGTSTGSLVGVDNGATNTQILGCFLNSPNTTSDCISLPNAGAGLIIDRCKFNISNINSSRALRCFLASATLPTGFWFTKNYINQSWSGGATNPMIQVNVTEDAHFIDNYLSGTYTGGGTTGAMSFNASAANNDPGFYFENNTVDISGLAQINFSALAGESIRGNTFRMTSPSATTTSQSFVAVSGGTDTHAKVTGNSFYLTGTIPQNVKGLAVAETNAQIDQNTFNGFSGVGCVGFAVTASPTLIGHNAFTSCTTNYTVSGTQTYNEYTIGGNAKFLSGMTKRTITQTAAYTLTATDYKLLSNLAAAATHTLPSAVVAGAGAEYVIEDISGACATNTITLAATAGTINGAATKTLTTNYGRLVCTSDGINWWAA